MMMYITQITYRVTNHRKMVWVVHDICCLHQTNGVTDELWLVGGWFGPYTSIYYPIIGDDRGLSQSLPWKKPGILCFLFFSPVLWDGFGGRLP